MTEPNTDLLKALTREGVLAGVSVRYWRANKRLKAQDLGLDPDRVSDRLISLGHKRLLPREAIAASAFGLPLLKLDAGKLFGGLVGQSEANLRSAIGTAEAVAPCVLWIDEIEKGFSGAGSSGNTDGGTSARVFGAFLNWMQEKTAPVFVVATANDVSGLPPEFLRKGRFDELFFVDLPNREERTAIWNIVIAKYGRNLDDYDCVRLARATETFTGAEIERAFIDALHLAFDNKGSEPGELTVGEALTEIVPLHRLMGEKIEALRHWARGRARHATHRDAPSNGRRKLDI